jgi:hypothetical protein
LSSPLHPIKELIAAAIRVFIASWNNL